MRLSRRLLSAPLTKLLASGPQCTLVTSNVGQHLRVRPPILQLITVITTCKMHATNHAPIESILAQAHTLSRFSTAGFTLLRSSYAMAHLYLLQPYQ